MHGEKRRTAAVPLDAGPVVIADGDTRASALVSAALQRAGYETIEVTTGLDALEAVRAHGARLVILEIRLPDMTGYAVCHEIQREHGEDLPIFFLTNMRTRPLDRVAGLLLGAHDFITKPFEPDELIARVRRVVDRGAPRREKPAAEARLPSVTP